MKIRTQKGRDLWRKTAATILAEGEAMTLESLCQASGRTRGAFYHHFEDMKALMWLVFSQWREDACLQLIHRLKTDSDNRMDIHGLLAGRLDLGLERALRHLAWKDPALSGIVAQVDRMRRNFLTETLRLRSDLTDEAASHAAHLAYASFLGQILWLDVVSDDAIQWLLATHSR